MDSSTLARFGKLLKTHKFVFLVVYRGHWCPFCMAYLREFSSLSKEIHAAGGIPIIVTAEDAQHLDATRKSTGYDGEAIVDQQHRIVAELKRRGLVDVAITDKKGYPNGMAQPAVLVMTSEGTVLQKWAIVPSMMNMGGATDRPDLQQIWDNSQAVMNGQAPRHERLSHSNVLKVLWKKLFG